MVAPDSDEVFDTPMRRTQQAGAALGMARARFLGQRVPVAVRINLNNRCHSRCTYCSFWYTPTEEMSTSEVRSIIAQLGRLGTKRLSLSGGEPMLRKDLGELIETAVAAGISVGLNTTGYLFRRRIAALRSLDLVKFSVDGPREVHDAVRGRDGAFDELLDAIEVAKSEGLRFSFAFTMTGDSLSAVPWAIDFAEQHGTFVAFQPVMAHEHASADVEANFPSESDYRDTIALLEREKRRRPKTIRNSLGGLDHIRSWPKISGLKCWAGDVFMVIEPNGDLLPCDRITYDRPTPNCRTTSVRDALAQLPPVDCAGCGFCGSVELNLLMAGKVADVVPAVLGVTSSR